MSAMRSIEKLKIFDARLMEAKLNVPVDKRQLFPREKVPRDY